MFKKLMMLVAFVLPTTTLAGEPTGCEVIKGTPDVKICYFDPEDSPACHKLGDYPGGPDQLAAFYGAQVTSYKYDPQNGKFVLVIVRGIGDGKMGSIALSHKGEPNAGVEEGTEACIVAIGTQLDPPT